MKKFLALSLLLGTSAIFVPAAEAKTADTNLSTATLEANASPQIYRQNRRWNRRGVRVVNRTRIVRVGFRTYREVIQTRYQPNGRVTTRVISRTRIR